MAIFNEILSGRFNRAVQKIFAIKAKPPVRQLAGEISVVHEIASGVEHRYLESWNRFAVSFAIPTAAAIQGTLRIRNPLTSNVIAVIEKITVSGEPAADQVRLGLVVGNADLVVLALSIINTLDTRQGNQGAACILSNSDATHPNSGITSLIGFQPANSFYEFLQTQNQEIPILPGRFIDIYANTVNQAVNVSLIWRERSLEESERS